MNANIKTILTDAVSTIEYEKKQIDAFCKKAEEETIQAYEIIFKNIAKGYVNLRVELTKDELDRYINNDGNIRGTVNLSIEKFYDEYHIDPSRDYSREVNPIPRFLKQNTYCKDKLKRYGLYLDSYSNKYLLVDTQYLKKLLRDDGFDIEIDDYGHYLQGIISISVKDFQELVNKAMKEKEDENKKKI